jgi:hypothetical protein
MPTEVRTFLRNSPIQEALIGKANLFGQRAGYGRLDSREELGCRVSGSLLCSFTGAPWQ